jgi:hypothetical protein
MFADRRVDRGGRSCLLSYHHHNDGTAVIGIYRITR